MEGQGIFYTHQDTTEDLRVRRQRWAQSHWDPQMVESRLGHEVPVIFLEGVCLVHRVGTQHMFDD
jgi:hypothetical protein